MMESEFKLKRFASHRKEGNLCKVPKNLGVSDFIH